MKTLKFKPHLCEQIIRGEKTATWRLFDDKDLQEQDEIRFINQETLAPFGTGRIEKIQVKTLGTLTESDWVGHEKFSSEKEMYDTYKSYYGNKVKSDSELKIIDFSFQAV